MRPWQVQSDQRLLSYKHTVAQGFGHSLLAQITGWVFELVRVPASLTDGAHWWPLHLEPPNESVLFFESAYVTDRSGYNERSLAEVRKHHKTFRGEHAGFCDLFVPVIASGQLVATIVTGPFALSRLSGADIRERWQRLTGRQAHPTDPEFATYLTSALSILVLDQGKARVFEELLECMAKLIAGEGDADEIANQADQLRRQLEPVRLVDRTWNAVRMMVDDRSERSWSHANSAYELSTVGLSRVADHLLVALAVNRGPETDPVDEAVRRDAFQRAAVELARRVGNVIAGQVGDHGIVFLSAATGSAQRKKQKLVELSDRASKLAHRFGLRLHFGASVAAGSVPLSRSYQAALGAAEAALTQGIRMESADPMEKLPPHSLRELRQELARALEDRPALLPARFDRYLEAVAAHCGHRIDVARGHLEAGFERVAEPLASSGAIDHKNFGALYEGLERSVGEARTLSELFAAYRRVVADLVEAVQRPVPARRERSLRAAVDYIHQHYREPLAITRVARVAGFGAHYFSRLFKEREGLAFADYVSRLRVEQAKQLLSSNELDITRIAALCGFNSSQYFARVFRRLTGLAPNEYRQGTHHTRPPKRKKVSRSVES
ncbi:MAG TPA: helix-turn-helix domain-containing protein [Polyangiaceae bacterium]|nr:helix-turn-helix domain-containing protein [Polyangiaceae bacterium]